MTDLWELENEIYELAGTNFNIASPKQLGTILFETLMLVASTFSGIAAPIHPSSNTSNKDNFLNFFITHSPYFISTTKGVCLLL